MSSLNILLREARFFKYKTHESNPTQRKTNLLFYTNTTVDAGEGGKVKGEMGKRGEEGVKGK